MANVRINALTTTATSAASDDYFALDGATNGTRKILGNSFALLSGATFTGGIVSTLGTLTTSTPMLDGTQTWNAAGTTFTGLKLNVTDTASAAGSLLLDLQKGATSQFSVDKGGNASLLGNATVSGTGNSSVAGTLLLGTTTNNSNGRLQLASSTSSSGGIGFGTDTPLYRSAANILNLGDATSKFVFKVYGGNAADQAPVLSLFRNGHREGFIAQGVSSGSLWIGNSGGLANYNDATLAAAAGISLDGSNNATFSQRIIGSGSSLTGSTATSLLDLSQTWNTTGNPTAIKLNVTNTASGASSNLLDLQVGGTSYFKVDKSGTLTLFGNGTTLLTQSGAAILSVGLKVASDLLVAGGSYSRLCIDHDSSSISFGANRDLWLYRDAANALAQRNSTSAQSYRLYNTYTSGTSYERLGLNWATNVAQIYTEKGSGGGTARDLVLGTNATTAITISGTTQATSFAAVTVLKNYTVGTLPTASSYTYGTAFVSDAMQTAGTFIGTAPTGGGSVVRAVYSDGTNWLLL